MNRVDLNEILLTFQRNDPESVPVIQTFYNRMNTDFKLLWQEARRMPLEPNVWQSAEIWQSWFFHPLFGKCNMHLLRLSDTLMMSHEKCTMALVKGYAEREKVLVKEMIKRR